jgi:hypothetical protein
MNYNIILLCILCMCSCSNNNKGSLINLNKTSDSIRINSMNCMSSSNKQLSIRDSLLENYKNTKQFSYIEKIKNGEYVMEIETYCINDTLSLQDAVDSLTTRPIIVKQKLIFKKRDSILNSRVIPLRSICRNNYHGNKVKALEVIIFQLFVINGKKGSIFGIYGSGLCNGSNCPEYNGFYTMEGLTLYQGYLDKYNQKLVNKIFKIYDISDTSYSNSLNNGIEVDRFWHRNF